MVTERVAIWDFLVLLFIRSTLLVGETFCVFVKNPVQTFLFFVKKVA